MSREFKRKLNIEALDEDYVSPKKFDNKEANEIMQLSKDILGVFNNNGTDMETAYLVLISLADAIYVSSLYGFDSDLD